MRKILGKKDNSKQNQLILGVGLIILMLFSVLGYALGGKSNNTSGRNIEYNGIKFTQDNSGYWNFELNGNEFLTKYHPGEIQDIEFKGKMVLIDFNGDPVYFVGDSQEPIAELARNLEKFVLRIQNACINEEDCEGDLPIKNCFENNIIIIKEPGLDEFESISQQGNCIYITASYINQTRYADQFIYSILEI
jgi:hypothetical protein